MKRKVLKQLVCVLGMVSMTFPAWSAVPTQLLPDDGSQQQTRVTTDFDSGVILAKGGKSDSGGGSRGGKDSGGQGGTGSGGQGGNEDSGGPNGPGDGTCDNCDGEPDLLRIRDQKRLQEQSHVRIQHRLWLQTQTQQQARTQNINGDGNSGSAQ